MKIRTDFVTNSSSSSFISYTFNKTMLNDTLKMLGMPPLTVENSHPIPYELTLKESSNSENFKIRQSDNQNLAKALINLYVGQDAVDCASCKEFDELSRYAMGQFREYRGKYEYPEELPDYQTYQFTNQYVDGEASADTAIAVLSELFLHTDFCERLIKAGYGYSEEEGGGEIDTPYEISVSDGRISGYTEYGFGRGFSSEDNEGLMIDYAGKSLLLQDGVSKDGDVKELGLIQREIDKYADIAKTFGLKKLTVHCKACEKKVVVPEGVEEVNFANCTELEEIVLPKTVRRIGALAFENCKSLKKITAAPELEYAAKSAVIGCNELTEAPEMLLTLDRSALPDGTVENESGSFLYENGALMEFTAKDDITELIIPERTLSIADRMFSGLISITSVTIPEGINEIGSSVFKGCSALTAIALPEGTIKLGDGCFRDCTALSSVSLPKGLTTIQYSVFENCESLVEVALPDSITEIEDRAFWNCTALTKVAFSPSECKIQNDAFVGCAQLKDAPACILNAPHYAILNGIVENETGVFTYEKGRLVGFQAKEGVTDIIVPVGTITVAGVFYQNDMITSITFPEGVKTIESAEVESIFGIRNKPPFTGCIALRSIYLPDSLISYPDEMFAGCTALTECRLSSGVSRLSEKMFKNCISLKKLHIPEGVKKMEGAAFIGCDALTEIELPTTISELDKSFQYRSALERISCQKALKTVEQRALVGCEKLHTICIGEECIELAHIDQAVFALCGKPLPTGAQIKNDVFIKYYPEKDVTEVSVPEGITKIASEAFAFCAELKTINLPDSVTEIDASAFKGCRALKSIDLPDGITAISDHLFDGCSALELIKLPDGITKIGFAAFSRCSSLKSFDLPDDITSISAHLFSGCSALESIKLPDGITSIGCFAFSACSALKSIDLHAGITEIDEGAFLGCSALEPIKLPDSITAIGKNAFRKCSSLVSIEFPKGYAAFPNSRGCLSNDQLKTIVLTDTVPTICGSSSYEYPFIDCENLSVIQFRCKFGTCYIGCTYKTIPQKFKAMKLALEMLEAKDFAAEVAPDVKNAFIAMYYTETRDEAAAAYVKENLSKILAKQIKAGDAGIVKAVLEAGDLLDKKAVNKYIKTAEKEAQPEIAELLKGALEKM